MRKILVYGDSHVANIAMVAPRLTQPDVKFIFFSAPGPVSSLVFVEDHCLKLKPAPARWPNHPTIAPETFQQWYEGTQAQLRKISENNDYLDFSKFDAVIVYGGGLGLILNSAWWKLSTLSVRCSQPFLMDMLEESFNSIKASTWLGELKPFIETGGTVFYMPPPLLNEQGFGEVEEADQNLKMLRSTPENANYCRDFLPALSVALAKRGVRLLNLPDELFDSSFRATKSSFKFPKPKDFAHLNEEGALLVLGNLIAKSTEQLTAPKG